VAREAGLSDADQLISEVLREVPQALSRVGRALPPGFPARLSGKIFEGVERQAKVLAAG
jgi:hypothetical protein